jgi:hypothetical protein
VEAVHTSITKLTVVRGELKRPMLPFISTVRLCGTRLDIRRGADMGTQLSHLDSASVGSCRGREVSACRRWLVVRVEYLSYRLIFYTQ